LLLLAVGGCGGGSSSGGGGGSGGNSRGTAAGSYNVTIMGSSGSLSHTATIRLKVN